MIKSTSIATCLLLFNCVTQFIFANNVMTVATVSPKADQVVAIVNNEKIFQSDVDFTIKTYLPDLNFGQIISTPEKENLLNKLNSEIIDALINNLLLEQAIKEKKTTVSVAEMHHYLESQMKDFLVDAELSLEQYKKITAESFGKSISEIIQDAANDPFQRNNLLRMKFIKDATTKDSLDYTEKDALIFYNKNKQDFSSPAVTHVAHILLKVDENPSNQLLVFDASNKLYQQIISGGNFAELAKKHSQCTSANNAGDLGLLNSGEMFPEFEQALNELNVGQISKPIKTALGYHIIFKKAEKKSSILAFSDVKTVIIKRGRNEKMNYALKNVINELHKQADIKVFYPSINYN